MVRRGDIVLAAFSNDYGKVRPVVVIQSDVLSATVDSRTACLMTTDLLPTNLLRVDIAPTEQNGLQRPSQVQIEKVMTHPAAKMRGPIGRPTDEQMQDITRRLRFHLDL